MEKFFYFRLVNIIWGDPESWGQHLLQPGVEGLT